MTAEAIAAAKLRRRMLRDLTSLCALSRLIADADLPRAARAIGALVMAITADGPGGWRTQRPERVRRLRGSR